jgi:hydroxymethylpyrimidine pyrophosphatase-like HAD family hydrolase
MCFGDDYNDLELFRAAGHSVAMGNAVDDLKEIASEVTLTNDEDGVAVVLERILGELGDKEPE